jgi:hypothetical protein
MTEDTVTIESVNGGKVVSIDSKDSLKIDACQILSDTQGEPMQWAVGIASNPDGSTKMDSLGNPVPEIEKMSVGNVVLRALDAFKKDDEPSMKKKRYRWRWKKRFASAMDNGDEDDPEATGDTMVLLSKTNCSFLMKAVHAAFPQNVNIFCAMEEILDPGASDLDDEEPEDL